MIVQVPTLSGADVTTHNYGVAFDIAKVTYQLTFRYSRRMRRWLLSMARPDGIMVLLPSPIVHGVDLLRDCLPELKPPGLLVCVPASDNQRNEPEEFGLGRDSWLLYMTRIEDLDDVQKVRPPLA